MVFGREEWIEQPRLNFRWDSFAGVRDFQHHHVRLPVGQPLPVRARAQRDRALPVHAVHRVLHQVEQHLLDLRRVHPDAQRRRGFPHQLNAILRQLRLEQRLHLLQRLLSRDRHQLRVGGPRKPEEVIHNSLEAQNLSFHQFNVTPLRRARRKLLLLDE